MKDLKENPVKVSPKKKTKGKTTVSQPTGTNKFQAKTTATKSSTAKQSVAKPINVNQIVIEKLIVHIIDPKEPSPTLSKYLLNPKIHTEAFKLVQKHIFNILHNKRSREAIFTSHGSSSVCDLSKTACAYPSKFIVSSQKLARLFHAQVKRIPNTGECDLAICQYHIEKKPDEEQQDPEIRQNEQPEKQLAILKLRMSYGLRNIVKTAGEVILENSEPFTFRELQKGALVQSCDPNSPCNLLILDNQTEPLYQKKVAIYFKDNYLKSVYVNNSLYLTRRLYESLIEIENDLVKAGLYQDVELIHKLQVYFFKKSVFNPRTWMRGSGLPAYFVVYVDTYLKEHLTGISTFKIDQGTYQRDLAQARFRGSSGLALQVPQDSLSMISLPKVPPTPGKPAQPTLITLKTNDWVRLK